ncbi:flagellar basal body-associated protein FliL [Vibrio sp. SCSIO 43136]|uniref:flagellar basal body-associated protein FliL n=1 Tax=Vibrio sp. SCSIO 43136 TaxID=2819101 RepID=UPI002075B5D8|nr:flagellar basal body-associated protein FliL [Vibrio sp. SCSIO 43136]USD65980.1 flagellar basal body-associated protein FliL [Vibrio sp. SCSIO 43136]
MADEQTQEEAPKGKSKLLIIIIAVVVLLAAGGGAAFFFLGGSDEEAADESAPVEAVVVNEPASYVNIAQPFLFNVTGGKKGHLVQIKVQLMVRGSENEQLAKHHSPLIESTLLATFGVATTEQLRSAMGRTNLRDQATEDIKAALTELVGQPVIEKVLFTDFVMQ